MDYKLLFLDVDGTLKQEPYGISEYNKAAVLKACQAGKKVSIASGRNRDLILQTVKELKLEQFGASYTIALNGAHIIDNQSGKTLHTVPIPYDIVYQLFSKANEMEITCHVYTENYIYFNYHDFQFDWYQNGGCTCELVDMKLKDMGLKEEPLKFFLLSKNSEKLVKYREEMAQSAEGILNAEYSTIYSLEYTSIHASKGLGLEYICGLHNIPLKYAIAAGDGENDISMLRMAGLGIAMKNALDSVKKNADTISERACTEDGVADIINRYLLV